MIHNIPRIGLGIDSHRLEAGRPCRLGGVEIPSPVGPVGHSDGDVILHAVCDALLGAIGSTDLGSLFPDTDAKHAGADSADFCKAVYDRVRRAGVEVGSIDVVVEAERPKIAPHQDAIRRRIAGLFHADLNRVNVRGKTAEGLDSIGRGEAIRATAIALVFTAGQGRVDT